MTQHENSLIQIRQIKKRLFELTEQLAAKELDINPKEYIMRESYRTRSDRLPSFVNNSSECQLQFDSQLMLPEESKVDDTEYGLFFDAVEKLHRDSYKKNPQTRSNSIVSELPQEGFDKYGEALERSELPWLKDPDTKISLWAIIKDCIGKDLSKIAVPVYINDPTSTL